MSRKSTINLPYQTKRQRQRVMPRQTRTTPETPPPAVEGAEERARM